jgi:transcriptional regulator with XRE-family HTH domain
MGLNREALIAIRVLAGFSQAELSRRSNVSQGHISGIEKGEKKNVQPATIKKLADAMGVPMGALMVAPEAVAS